MTGAPDLVIDHCVRKEELLPLVAIAGNEKVAGKSAQRSIEIH